MKRIAIITLIAAVFAVGAGSEIANAAPVARKSSTPATVKARMFRHPAGKWTWWGYRTDPWQTWAVATQSPTYVRGLGIPEVSALVYVEWWVLHLTAQNARSMGQCLGVTWTGSALIVGCA